MSTITRDLCIQKFDGAGANTFTIDPQPNPKQQKVYDLLAAITV